MNNHDPASHFQIIQTVSNNDRKIISMRHEKLIIIIIFFFAAHLLSQKLINMSTVKVHTKSTLIEMFFFVLI